MNEFFTKTVLINRVENTERLRVYSPRHQREGQAKAPYFYSSTGTICKDKSNASKIVKSASCFAKHFENMFWYFTVLCRLQCLSHIVQITEYLFFRFFVKIGRALIDHVAHRRFIIFLQIQDIFPWSFQISVRLIDTPLYNIRGKIIEGSFSRSRTS